MSEELDISRERVRQIQREAVQALKDGEYGKSIDGGFAA